MFGGFKISPYLCTRFPKGVTPKESTPSRNFVVKLNSIRAFSSAGSEHLPYKQRVGGSNPSTPT